MKTEKPTGYRDAIVAFCIECMGGQQREVKNCTAPKCPLFEFRNGENPYRKRTKYTDEQKEAMRERMSKARESKS